MDLQAKSEWIKVWSSPKPWHSISVLNLEVHGLHIWPELWTPNCADLLKFCCLNQNQHLHQNRSFIFSQLPHACSPFLWRRSAGCGCPTQSGCCKFWGSKTLWKRQLRLPWDGSGADLPACKMRAKWASGRGLCLPECIICTAHHVLFWLILKSL